MIVLAFFQWWYGPGWSHQFKRVTGRFQSVAATFSLGIIIRTLFAPWKQIVTETRHDQAVNIKLRAGVDNLVSRFVGFSIRSIVLFTAFIALIVSTILSLLLAILWPLLPAIVLFLLPLGFFV